MFEVTLELKPDNIEMRKVYGNVVREKIVENTPIIALEADLMSAMAMDGVHRDHPQHVINCGIMEANVIGVAAGLSLTGRVPFVHTFTAFASRRCFDQLFMSLDYQKNNVKVIASDAGVTACHNGGTHMSFEDMGIVRGLANSIVLEVTDAVLITFLPVLLLPVLGALGFANATFSDADFGVIGILLGNLARFMSKEAIMALIVAIFAALVAYNYLAKKPAAEKAVSEK